MARKDKTETIKTDEKVEIAEDNVDTAAGKSIEAHASVSRSDLMKNVVDGMSKLSHEDMTHWFTAAMALIGKENDVIPDGSAEKNKGSITAKPSHASSAMVSMGLPAVQVVREDLRDLLSDSDLPKELEEKTLVLFESAVSARVALERAKIEDHYENVLSEEAEAMVDDLDSYLDYAAREFFTENQVAIENSLRVDIYQEFVEGLRGLFEKHWVELPEEKVDVVSGLADEVEELKTRLNDTERQLLAAREAYDAERARDVFGAVAEGLTDTQVEKFKSLTESVEYDGDEEDLQKKLQIIRDAHFKSGGAERSGKTMVEKKFPGLIAEAETVTVTKAEDGPQTAQELTENADPEVRNYVAAISRTVGRQKNY